ncbi:MAG: 16S rRNA (uracil(1498)-N(3))-methyltransferase [Patescibacteria group bacterium]|nr:16S rRNA (uracil(1498)-N(3))-methyltransferase [Patescibacteria group bacterium]MCL5261829.1 16S rRNA (uracil(1498)-N(3))-methyltransferase [Patescibacteria group bacterium]
MKQHRFIGNFAPEGGYLELRDEELVNQIKNVLKLKPGEEVVFGDGEGSEFTGTLKSFHPRFISFAAGERRQNTNDPAVKVVLYCALLKKENFEWVAEKATEVGARAIFPIISDRTVKLNLNIGRLRKIVKEAAEQSGRGFLPEVSEIIGFDEAMEQARDNELNIFFDPKGQTFEKPQWFSMYGDKRVGVFIGPEGGWTDREFAAAAENDYQIASLGNLVLRAETAAVISVYLAGH